MIKQSGMGKINNSDTNYEIVNIQSTSKDKLKGNEIDEFKKKELQNCIFFFNSYQDVEDNGKNVRLSKKLVMTEKNGEIKARLVARGFEEDFPLPRNSPTVGKGAMRIFIKNCCKPIMVYQDYCHQTCIFERWCIKARYIPSPTR